MLATHPRGGAQGSLRHSPRLPQRVSGNVLEPLSLHDDQIRQSLFKRFPFSVIVCVSLHVPTTGEDCRFRRLYTSEQRLEIGLRQDRFIGEPPCWKTGFGERDGG